MFLMALVFSISINEGICFNSLYRIPKIVWEDTFSYDYYFFVIFTTLFTSTITYHLIEHPINMLSEKLCHVLIGIEKTRDFRNPAELESISQ